MACVLAVAGCKDDDHSTDVGSLKVAGSGGGGGASGGKGGAGAGAGAGGGGAVFMPPMRPMVACGAKQCTQTLGPVMGFELQTPCCLDEAKGTCGWEAPSGGKCVAPPKVVATCPASPFNPEAQPGCCIAQSDRCGIDGSPYGVGCYDLAGSMFNDGSILARTCDGTVIEDTDGGVEDDDAGLAPEPAAGSGGAAGGAAGKAGAGAAGKSGGAAGAAGGK